MLNPTVGIELCVGLLSVRFSQSRNVMVTIGDPRTKESGIARGGNILEGEFSALLIAEVSICAAEEGLEVERVSRASYRQNSQQRCLSCVLQADHCNIHLGRPIQQIVPISSVFLQHQGVFVICFFPCKDGSHKIELELTQ